MESSDQQDRLDEVENAVTRWHPRAILRRTNWLYHVDALRPTDLTYLNSLQDVIIILREYATQFLTMAGIWVHLKVHGRTVDIRERANTLFPVVIAMSQVFVSEGYCYLMDYFQVAYYPSTNRIS